MPSSFPTLSSLIWFLVLASYYPVADGTQSVFSCPLTPQLGLYPGALGYANGMGEVCGIGSFVHYWTCCDDAPFECCFNFETWAIVFFSVSIVLLVAVCLFAAGRFFSTYQD